MSVCGNCGTVSSEGAQGFDADKHNWYCSACWAKWDADKDDEDNLDGDEADNVVRVLSGFGEPWRVVGVEYDKHAKDMLPVRWSNSDNAPLVGALRKGDIIGVRQVTKGWAELMPDADMRLWTLGGEFTTLGGAVGQYKEFEVERKLWDRTNTVTVKRKDPECKAWVKTNGNDGKQLLEKVQVGDTGITQDYTVRSHRATIYSRVLELCRKRIYVDHCAEHLEAVPTLESLQAKLLFQPNSYVAYATISNQERVLGHQHLEGRHAFGIHYYNPKMIGSYSASKFEGGAVLREFSVRAWRQGLAIADVDGGAEGGGDGIQGMESITVCYIDMCAGRIEGHAGTAIYSAIMSMGFACVACHSWDYFVEHEQDGRNERLPEFWKARGMRQFKVNNTKDRAEFKRQLLLETGKVCELADVYEALPCSDLPLFLRVVPFSYDEPSLPVRKRPGRQLSDNQKPAFLQTCLTRGWKANP